MFWLCSDWLCFDMLCSYCLIVPVHNVVTHNVDLVILEPSSHGLEIAHHVAPTARDPNVLYDRHLRMPTVAVGLLLDTSCPCVFWRLALDQSFSPKILGACYFFFHGIQRSLSVRRNLSFPSWFEVTCTTQWLLLSYMGYGWSVLGNKAWIHILCFTFAWFTKLTTKQRSQVQIRLRCQRSCNSTSIGFTMYSCSSRIPKYCNLRYDCYESY